MKLKYTDQLMGEIKALKKGYPDFVFSSKNEKLTDKIPVFIFHSFEPESFEEQLKYLNENEYKTLSADEYVDILEGKKEAEENSILLTVDDARISFWIYGFPLLKKYKMKAALFVIPGHTKQEVEIRKNLSDVWEGRAELSELKNIDPSDEIISNWKELKIMHESGLIDIEIHTLFHKEIFTDFTVNNFITDGTPLVPYNSPASPYLSDENIGKGFLREELIGYPLFNTAPLMSGAPAANIPESIIEESQKLYSEFKENGKTDSSAKENLIKKLNLKLAYKEKEFLDAEDIIYNDLKTSKELIKKNIDENSGKHLCFPWTLGSETAIQACKTIGIKSCFWGIREDRKINKPLDDPYYSCRIKSDFIFRLPGKGRKSLPSIYGAKIKRRLSGERVF